MTGSAPTLVVAATNIHGLGATQLVRSLLPSLARVGGGRLSDIVTPDDDRLSAGIRSAMAGDVRWHRYPRSLPNAVSRVIECLFMGERLAKGAPMLVLGDLPYRIAGRQVVFVQTPFLIAGSASKSASVNLKSAISRALFRANLKHVHRVVVQTDAMRNALVRTYPSLEDRIAIIKQPPPAWVLDLPVPAGAPREVGRPLNLFFPASPYAHKNHAILYETAERSEAIGTIDLTVERPSYPVTDGKLHFHGVLDPETIATRYCACDALVFPSLEESYGLPLVEAMYLRLPILVADRPYAHALCDSDGVSDAIYFDPRDAGSLARAAADLRERLDSGWRPDWTRQLAAIPKDWDDVGRQMLALFA